MPCRMASLSLPIPIDLLIKNKSVGGLVLWHGWTQKEVAPDGPSNLGGLRGLNELASLRGYHALGGFCLLSSGLLGLVSRGITDDNGNMRKYHERQQH